MALVLADRVQEYSTTTGTGTLTLSGAYAGFQTFAAGIGNGNTCYYTITSDTNQWEVGIGTVGVGTLARTTLISSSTGSLVSFTGTLTVFVTYPAEKAVYSDSTTIVAPSGALLPITSGGTGASTAATARTALGLGTIATQAANSVAITGGAIDGTTVGSTTASAGSFTTLTASSTSYLGGSSTSRMVQIDSAASNTVSYMQFTKFVALNENQMLAQGTANLGLVATGGGGIYFRTADTSQLQAVISNTTSAVNYLNLTGAATGAAPTISTAGSDANISLVLNSKGTGLVALGGSTVANSGLRVNPVASSVNYVQAQGGITGNPATVSSQGSDSNVTLWLQAQGNARTFFVNSGAFQAAINPNGAAVNYLLLAGGSTGNGAELSVAGSDTNINLKLTPKGTGVLQFGTYTAGVIAQAGYITITDAAGTSRRLLVG
jgi:hypothetical protein